MITDYLLLALSVGVNVAGNSINNSFSKGQKQETAALTARAAAGEKYLYNVLVSLASLIMVMIFDGSLKVSGTTLWMGVLFGLLNGASFITRTFALAEGPMSLSLLIGSCGMLIPTFSGVLFWNETMTVFQLVGVMMMVVSLVLIMNAGVDKKISLQWCLLCFGMFLCTGFISIMQKVQQNSAFAEERAGFLMVAFITSIVLNGLIAAGCFHGTKWSFKKTQAASGLLTGCCTGANHMLNLYLSGVIPAIIFFPLVNGGGILLSGLVGTLVFREKCSKRQLIGFLLGVAAILFIGGVVDGLI